MWMDAYVHQTLIRQQIAESERTAAVRCAVRLARSSAPRTPWRAVIHRLVRTAVDSWSRRLAERVALR